MSGAIISHITVGSGIGDIPTLLTFGPDDCIVVFQAGRQKIYFSTSLIASHEKAFVSNTTG